MTFTRPSLPYTNVPLPNSNRYRNLSNSSPSRPPTAEMLDGDINYLNDTCNTLAQQIADIVAGNIPGSDNPLNAFKFTTTDGEGNISWVFADTDNIIDRAITQDKLDLESVGTEQYQDGSITNPKLAPQSVDTRNYVLGSVKANQLGDQAVTHPKLADGAVQQNNYYPLSIPEEAFQDGCIPTRAIQFDAITTPLLLDQAVSLQKLAVFIQQSLVPTGTILPFGGLVAPQGYFLCDGSNNISRTAFSGLFDVIGTTYGAGDGSTTYGLPDLRGRLTAGSINNNTAERITTATATTTNIGGSGGEETNTLTTRHLPNFSLTYNTLTFTSGVASAGTDIQTIRNPTPSPQNTSSIGDGQPVNNMPPFLLVNYIIKN